MSSLGLSTLLHTGHSGGISNNVIAMALVGAGLLLIGFGVYRLYTYDEVDATDGLESERSA